MIEARGCDMIRRWVASEATAFPAGPAWLPDRRKPERDHPMQITFQPTHPGTLSVDALIVPIASGTDGAAPSSPLLAELDGQLDGVLAGLLSDARFTGASGRPLVVATLGRLPARRLILTGIGAGDSDESLRLGYAAAASAAREAGAVSIAIALPDGHATPSAATAAIEASCLALYRFTTYYGTAHKGPDAADPETITVADPALDPTAGQAALDLAAAIVTGTTLARDLVNEPANVLDPGAMAVRAAQVAEASGLEYIEIGVTQLAELGAGAILAVGRGSRSEPRLIHLIYRPPEGIASGRRIGLVGKTITFDTGGYSIKTGEGMLDMKIDMAGGAAVLGTMSALTAIGCPHEVHGVICAAENMISGDAFRPGDVLTAMNGVTIEILSTDAEGRLVLADGLVYTSRQGVEEMIDLATLTGAAVVALGNTTAAVFSSDDALWGRIDAAGQATGEDLWRMPLTPSMNEQIRGDVADIKNTGGRPGGAISAALFLERFREGLPWAHLDIAGPTYTKSAKGYLPRGATGFGVRTLLSYLSAPTD